MYTTRGRHVDIPFFRNVTDQLAVIQSLTYGRPPSLAMAHVDCKMAHETRKDANGSVEMSCACAVIAIRPIC